MDVTAMRHILQIFGESPRRNHHLGRCRCRPQAPRCGPGIGADRAAGGNQGIQGQRCAAAANHGFSLPEYIYNIVDVIVRRSLERIVEYYFNDR